MPELLTAPPDLLTSRRRAATRAVTDAEILTVRSIRLVMRRPDAMLTALLMPIMLMLVFGYIFGGAIHTGTSYVTFLAPGIILTCVVLGSSTTAVSVNGDMTHGIIDRFKSLDIGGPAFLTSHVAASVLRNIVSAALVFAVAFPMGFQSRAGAGQWLAAAGIIILLILAVSWLSAVAGLVVRSPEAASSITFFMMLVPFTSSAFVPVSTMPAWLAAFARNQPATLIIDSIRDLLERQPLGSTLLLAVAWSAGLVLGFVLLSQIIFPRRTG